MFQVRPTHLEFRFTPESQQTGVCGWFKPVPLCSSGSSVAGITSLTATLKPLTLQAVE